jgi:DNA-binding GntR family transcriptional regulator
MERQPGRITVGQLNLQTAPEAAAQAIRESIISGELRGGDRIIEQKWAARLGIGQPTLREALSELIHQGLLRKLPQRGTYVAQLSPRDYRLIQEVRIPLEAIAVGKAAENLTPEADAELGALVKAMSGTSMTASEVKNFHDCDAAFHRKIWMLAGNEHLRDTLEAISFKLFVFSVVGRWADNPKASRERVAAVKQHLAILEGIRSRDKHVARRVFIQETVGYWNAQYGLELDEKELSWVGHTADQPSRPVKKKHRKLSGPTFSRARS